MRMELIQPFIDAADSVFSETLQSPAKIGDLSMDENAYRRKGVAALIAIKGDIEGRVILDLSPEVAIRIAGQLAGMEVQPTDQVVRETVCELANMVIGNSVKVFPPEIHANEEGLANSVDTEALVLCLETPCGEIYLNIAMHYLHRRSRERDTVPAVS
jgi:chemotaxis protein CheX